MVLPILPIYATTRFGMSYETVTLLNAVFFGAQFVAGPFIGRLSDRYGRLPILIISQIGTVISFILLGLAGSVEMLFFARILDGITGGNIIVAQAYVTDITPKEQRTQALGYIFASFGVGFIFGPAIGGILASTFSYETPYFFAAGAAAFVVFLTWRLLDESLTAEQRESNRSKQTRPLGVRTVLFNIPLVSILAMSFAAQLAFAMLQSTFALFGEAVLFPGDPDQAQLGVGLLLATIGVGQIFTQIYLVKRLVKRFGDEGLVVVGSIVRSISMFVLVLAATPFAAVINLFLFAVGTGTQMPALQSLVTNTVEDNQRGAVLGLYQSAVSLSIIIGSAIAGSLFAIAPGLPYLTGGIIFAVITIPAIMIARWARQNRKSKRQADLIAPPQAAGD